MDEQVRIIKENRHLFHSSIEALDKQKFIEKNEAYTPQIKRERRERGSIVLSHVRKKSSDAGFCNSELIPLPVI